MMRIWWVCLWGGLAITAGCTITETGNPEFAGQMALLTETTSPNEFSIGPGGSIAVVEQAWVGFGDVRLVSDTGCDEIDEVEFDVPVPTPVDLAAGPAVVTFDVVMDDFCRVRVPMARAVAPLPAGAPPELDDAAIALSGTRADGMPFLIVSRSEREADVRSRTVPFAIDEGLRALLMAFDVAVWLDGVDLAGATVVGGRVLIDDDNNSVILDVLEDNVEEALRLYRDGDEDGELDPEDRMELLANGGP